MKHKHSMSMRDNLVIILFSLVVLQGVVLLSVLLYRDFYQRVDQQSVDMFYTRSNQQVETVNEEISSIVQQTVAASREMTGIYSTEATMLETQLAHADLTQSEYQNAHITTAKILLDILSECEVDTAFYILNGKDGNTTTTEIKNVYPDLEGDGYSAYELQVGSSQISKAFGIGISGSWDLEIPASEIKRDYYVKPLFAQAFSTYGDIEKYGYWEMPNSESDNGEIIYAVPLVDELGVGYGVVGIKISESYFQEHYINRSDFSYEDSFYFLASDRETYLSMNKALPNLLEADENYVDRVDIYPSNISGFDLYTAYTPSSGSTIIKTDKLSMYSSNSPFKSEEMTYVTVVPQSQLYQYSEEIKDIFFAAFSGTVVVCFFMSILAGRYATRKIDRLAEVIKELDGDEKTFDFPKTNFKEIDDLTQAITALNEKVQQSTRTLNNLFELTQLNLGGFEVTPLESNVQVTEYICKLLGIEKTSKIPLRQWVEYYSKLVEKVIDAENDIFVYWLDGDRKYLKIVQTTTEDSILGTVLDVTKEIEDVMEAKYKLDYDNLTKLYSRAAFYREAEQLMKASPKKVGAVVFIDLDNLKFVNDTFGHDYGDLYLITASRIFEEIANLGGVCGRMSGDEFAVYLHGYDRAEVLLRDVQEKMFEHKNASINLPDGTIQRVRFSSGVAWYNKDSSDMAELVKFADFAMYEAKHTAKGTLKVFNRESYDEKIFMMENREAINELIEDEKIDFALQPIVSLETGEIVAYEALMRSKMDMFKSPLEILKVASAQFKLHELERMVIRKAIENAYVRRNELEKGTKVFINSITSQILPVEIFDELKERYGKFLERIVIEITEAEDNTPEKMRQKVSTIKSYGMQIALDDFGSGYSNDLRIIAINPDVVKIDIELLCGISDDADKQLLCQNIINYSHSKNIQIVAEGIENSDDLQKIIELGADCVQGFYVLKPSFEMQEVPANIKREIRDLRQKL